MDVPSINSVKLSAITPKLNKDCTPKHIPAAGPFFYFEPGSCKGADNLLKTVKTLLSRFFHK